MLYIPFEIIENGWRTFEARRGGRRKAVGFGSSLLGVYDHNCVVADLRPIWFLKPPRQTANYKSTEPQNNHKGTPT